MSNIKQKQIKTLLVEDNERDACQLRKKLINAQEINFDLTHVERLDKAIQYLHQKDFDIILLDISLSKSRAR